MNLNDYIINVKDFPKKGIIFKDISPIFLDSSAFAQLIDELADMLKPLNATKLVAAEARGFMLGTPLAIKLGIGFVPARKKGKLPRETAEVTYPLEYGSDTICLHKEDIAKGDRVIVFDDILATGGTAKAMCDLVEGLGGEVEACAFLMELGFLKGRDKLGGRKVLSYVID